MATPARMSRVGFDRPPRWPMTNTRRRARTAPMKAAAETLSPPRAPEPNTMTATAPRAAPWLTPRMYESARGRRFERRRRCAQAHENRNISPVPAARLENVVVNYALLAVLPPGFGNDFILRGQRRKRNDRRPSDPARRGTWRGRRLGPHR